MVLRRNENVPRSAEILNSLVKSSPQTQIVTDLGLTMSVPAILLKMFSPTLASLLDMAPCLSTSIILPDTDIKTLSTLIDLLTNGQTKQSSTRSSLKDLAELLGISNFNVVIKDDEESRLQSKRPLQHEIGNILENIKEEKLNPEKSPTQSCTVCFKSFSSSISLAFHYCKHFFDELEELDISEFVDDQETWCKQCCRNFPDRRAVLCHVGVKHRLLNKVLRKKGIKPLDIGTDTKEESQVGEISCGVCSEDFSQSSARDMAKHYCHHFQDRLPGYFSIFRTNNTCKICKRYFKEESDLLTHIGVKHLKINLLLTANNISSINPPNRGGKTKEDPEEKPWVEQQTKYKCFKCLKYFSSSASFKVHICGHFAEELKPFIREDKTCNICGEGASSVQGLLRHIGMTHGKLNSILSSQGLPSLGSTKKIKTPRLRRLEVREVFCCELCDKEQFNASALSQHLIGSHNFLKDLKLRYNSLYQDGRCGLCQKMFAKTSIWQHLGGVHNKLDELLVERGLRPIRGPIEPPLEIKLETENLEDSNTILGSLFESVDKNLSELNERFNE